jgi:hypothetical protein
MNAVTINIPELDEHSSSWTILHKDSGAVYNEHLSRDAIQALDPEQFIVLTRHQYLLHFNAHHVSQIGAKNLLEHIERSGFTGERKYADLVSALKAFVE